MQRRPLWLWPNLLSLDAPLVAAVWLWMFAKTWRVVSFPNTIYWLVVVMVWLIYVLDRLLDSRVAGHALSNQTPRHQFHARFQKVLWFGVVVAGLAAIGLLLSLPTGLWSHGAFVLIFVVFYFVLVALQGNEGISHLKNILAGMAFACGTAVGVHFYRPDSNLFYFLLAPETMTFAVLCILNISAIDFWSARRKMEVQAVDQNAQELVLSLLPLALAGFCLLFAARADEYSKPFFLAVMTSSALLYVVDRIGASISQDLQRVLADVVMMASLLVFVVYYPF